MERPDLFFWSGEIDDARLRAWVISRQLHLPLDLFELLRLTGGGDMFESETLLRPFGGDSIGDNADERNKWHHERGLSQNLWLFHSGLFLSAVRRQDGGIVTIEGNYCAKETYESLDDWYIRELRSEFAERYGLPPPTGS